MSDPFVSYDGKRYSIEEAIELGLIPELQNAKKDCKEEEYDIEIIVDEETMSFRLQIDEKEALDIPKELLIDVFQISGFRGIREIVEEEGVDYDILLDIAKAMKLL
ncbi:hypothetical protein SMD22_00895 (plasmid) [Brevibacillus halotolerans]|nr:hypothetical protein SMD22_00895 [Brevibacillus halotolerans]